ncbi:MAG: H-X9-DG-CTERM domain-containing protein [Candidatus Brocadiia bacterium]
MVESLAGPAAIWKIMIILILGSQPAAEPEQHISLRQLSSPENPIYAELELNALRTNLQNHPKLQQKIYGNEDPRRAYEQAIQNASTLLRLKPALIHEMVGSIHQVAFCLHGFGEDEETFRFLFLFRCSNEKHLLDAFLKAIPFPRTALQYQGKTVYQFGDDPDESLWVSHAKGVIAIARDHLLIQKFLMDAQNARPVPSKQAVLFQADINCQQLFNEALTVESMELEELLVMLSLVDAASWRYLRASFDGRILELRAELEPGGRALNTLKGDKSMPNLARIIPQKALLAAATNLPDRKAASRATRQTTNQILAVVGDGDEIQELWEKFREETGLDLEKDIFDNLAEIGFVMTQLDADAFLLLGRVVNPDSARSTIQSFMNQISRSEGVRPTTLHGANVWEDSGGRIALKGHTVMVGSSRCEIFETLLKRPAGQTSSIATAISKQHPKATKMFMFNMAPLVQQTDVDPILVGFHFEKNELVARARFDPESLVRAFEAPIRKARKTAKRVECMNHLRQISMCCMMYANDHAGELPPDLKPETVKEYLGNNAEILLCPASNKKYVYRKGLGGQKIHEIANPSSVVLVHDAPESHKGGGNAAYVDGHVRWLSTEAFKRAINKPIKFK